jgi:iron complex outermembrane receptor protein
MKSSSLATVLIFGNLVASAALAQEPNPETSSPDASAAVGLQEIVVTAQRREESLQRAAIAVSAITGDALRAAGVTRPTELTALVPSLQVATSAGPYSLFYLRGVGNFNGNALSDAAVAFNADGVYVGRPSSTTGFFYDLERLEVVKGPQGTLYGRNATGGAINVISRQPALGEYNGNVVGEYGNEDTLRVDGAVNIPIGTKAAVRAAATHVEHEGYANDGTDDQDDTGARLSFRVDPTESLKIVLLGDYFRQKGNGAGSTIIANNGPFPGPAINVDDRLGLSSPQVSAFYSSQPTQISGRTFVPLAVDQFLDNDYWGLSSTIDWQSSAGTLTVIPAYRAGNLDFLTTTPGFQIRQLEDDAQTSIEARFASNDAHALRYLLGVFYYDESNDVPGYFVNSQANASFQDYHADTTSKAVFGRLTYAFTDAVRFTVGARQTSEDKDFRGTFISANRICLAGLFACPTSAPFPFAVFTPPAPDFNPAPDGTITVLSTISKTGASAQSASYDRFTWHAGADWDITDRNLLYTSFETGFKAGGFFFSGDAGVYRPESIRAFTLGSKNRFLDNRLELNAELFHWKYSDQQISHLGLDSFGTVIFPTENVGSATFKGIELELQFRPLSATLLNADVQYLDANYDDFVYTTPNLNGGVSNGTACPNLGAPTTVYTVNCSGFRPPNAPEWTINLGVEQTFPLSNGSKVVAAVRGHYQSETLTGLEFSQVEIQDAYTLVDASVTFAGAEDRYFLTAFINNAFDETIVGNTFPPPLSFFTVGSLRPPRTYGVRLGVQF